MKTATKSYLTTKAGKTNKRVLNAIRSVRFDSNANKIYPARWIKSGRHFILKDVSNELQRILELQGYKFEIANGGVRNGADCKYFKVSKIAFNFIRSLVSE